MTMWWRGIYGITKHMLQNGDEIDFPAESLRLPENIHYRIHILEFFLNQLELPQAYLEPSQSMMELFCLLSRF